MRIAIVGTGYVGLVSGACFADFGHEVTCVDNDEAKIAGLMRGEIPIFEPGLDELVAANVEASRLTFTTNLRDAARVADIVFIAVGTPSRSSDGGVDLSAVYAASRAIAGALQGFTVVALKSTVPVGTGGEVDRVIRSVNPDADVAVVSNPEFLREGVAISDFKLPDRVVVGLEDERAREPMSEAYRPLHLNQTPFVFTDRRSAELIKYAANAFLAMKIAFVNEIADLCENSGADGQEVARGIGLDNRIGPKFLNAGPGFGGSCLPKDTQALAQIARAYGSPLHLVETTVAINQERKRSMAQRIIAACGGSVTNKKIAIIGLTFKPGTDDMREAPSLAIVRDLQDAGANVRAFDPAGMESAKVMMENVAFAKDAYQAATGAHAIVFVTEWPALGALDLGRLKALMAGSVFIDLRNMYAPDVVSDHGFVYVGVGRKTKVDSFAAAAE